MTDFISADEFFDGRSDCAWCEDWGMGMDPEPCPHHSEHGIFPVASDDEFDRHPRTAGR